MNNTLKREKHKEIIFAVIAILFVLLVWQIATFDETVGKLIPGPIDVVKEFFISFVDPIGPYTLLGHVAWSMSRVFVGFGTAAFIGILLGLTSGWYRAVDAIFKPIVETIRPIPPIAWIPIAILWFGLGEMPKYFIIFIAAFNNVVINAYKGSKTIDPTLVGAAKMLGADDKQIFYSIVIPGSIPYIFSGLQVALSVSFTVLLAAEMVRSTEGIGWIIISGMAINDTTQIFVGIMTIGLIGFLLATVLRVIAKRALAWNHK